MKTSVKFNAILNIIKTLMKVVFPLITFPYVSRVIQATNYGKVNFGTSLVNYFLLIAALGINTYAIREGAKIRNQKERFDEFASQVFSINIITSFFSYLALLGVYLCWPKLHDYSSLLFVQSIIIICTTLGVDWIYSVFEDYLYITIRSILVQIVSLILLFVLVKSEEDYILYAGITVFANAGASIFNFFHARKYSNLYFTKFLNLRRHIKPMFILFFSNLTISFYVDSDITLLGIMQNDFTVGIYSIAVKVYTIVKQIIFSVITVMIPRLSFYRENDRDAYFDLLEKLKCLMLLVTLPLAVGVCLLSKNVILILSGAEYQSASTALSILSIAFPISALATIYGNGVLLVNNGEKYIFKSTLIGAIINVGLNIVLIPFYRQNAAAFTTVISEAIVAIMNYNYALKYMIHSKKVRKALSESIIECVFIFMIVYIVNKLTTNVWLGLILSSSISSLVYLAILIAFREEIIIRTLSQIFNKFRRRNNG